MGLGQLGYPESNQLETYMSILFLLSRAASLGMFIAIKEEP
jgi:hypothetical protein